MSFLSNIMAEKKDKTTEKKLQNPLILRYHRLMDAFSKSNDERDFYLDKMEGFIIYVNLDATEEGLHELEEVLHANLGRFRLIPKFTFYEVKKIMEGFINEKVYDIDIKEKLLEIIQSKEARENFLEFIYDQEVELEKWQLFYQERSRIRIIEWLRKNEFHFVFEEDLELLPSAIEQVKYQLFQAKVAKDVTQSRQALEHKAKTYYSNEALNPRPKRGRPPKQVPKVEVEPQLTEDYYTMVAAPLRPFLYTPNITKASAVTFSAKFDTEEELRAKIQATPRSDTLVNLEAITKKLSSLSDLSKNVPGIAPIDSSSATEHVETARSQRSVRAAESFTNAVPPPKEKIVPKPAPKEPLLEKETKRRLTSETPKEKKGLSLKRLMRRSSKEEGNDTEAKTPLKKIRRLKKK